MRVKRGFKARKRRKKVLKLAKGFRAGRSKLFRTAADAGSFMPLPLTVKTREVKHSPSFIARLIAYAVATVSKK